MRSWGKWRWILFCGVLWVVIALPITLGLEYFVLSEEFVLEKLWFKIPMHFISGIIWALMMWRFIGKHSQNSE